MGLSLLIWGLLTTEPVPPAPLALYVAVDATAPVCVTFCEGG